MKEIRCGGDCKTWRVAFAFTPDRQGLLLRAGDKSGMKKRLFYGRPIKKADERYDQFLKDRAEKKTARDESE